MAEIITLTTPLAGAVTNDYRLVSLSLDIQAQSVQMVARSNLGAYVTRLVLDVEAVNLLKLLNTANLSVKSLQRRALEYMASKGDFIGTVNGTPD